MPPAAPSVIKKMWFFSLSLHTQPLPSGRINSKGVTCKGQQVTKKVTLKFVLFRKGFNEMIIFIDPGSRN